jgi:hypothetical protein
MGLALLICKIDKVQEPRKNLSVGSKSGNKLPLWEYSFLGIWILLLMIGSAEKAGAASGMYGREFADLSCKKANWRESRNDGSRITISVDRSKLGRPARYIFCAIDDIGGVLKVRDPSLEEHRTKTVGYIIY